MTRGRFAAGVAALAVLAVGGMTMASASARPAPRPLRPSPTGAVTVTITGGHDTDPRDHGRPVVLIAAALGVPTEVFRTAFGGVTPAHAGTGPTEAQARANKAALLRVLAPYGVTNARLDEVSNRYRYNGSAGGMWPTTPATATATVVNGVVAVTITDAGSGYTSPPTITISGTGITTRTAIATLRYSTDFATNGSVSAITR